jgi:serine protease inhibitor
LRALHWDQPPDRLSKAFADLDVQLSRSGPGSAVLLVANGLWYQRGDPLRQAFLEAARGDYRAEVSGADFIGNP